jgi:hypothetical protein
MSYEYELIVCQSDKEAIELFKSLGNDFLSISSRGVGSRTPSTRLAGCWRGQLFSSFSISYEWTGSLNILTSDHELEIGETSYILGSHHPRALQGLGFDLVLVERGGG